MSDYTLEDTIYKTFTTRAFATGIPTVLAGTPVVSAYEDDSVTQITAGITLGVDHDGVVGLNLLTIVAGAASGFEAGKDYNLVITTGTVGGVSVVGETVFHFSLEKQAGSAKLVWDRLLTGATHNIATSAGRRLRGLQDFGLYEGGAIHIDTVNGTAGTVDFENGTVTNPVDTIADAITIAASIGLRIFIVVPGSTITLAASLDDWEVIGFDYTVALGGQSVARTLIRGANVSGTFSGMPRFEFCTINAITGPSGDFHTCGLASSITVDGAGDWFIHHSYSRVAGTGTPSFDFGAAVANTNLNMRSYSGGIELENMGATITDAASIEGQGQIILNVNCAGGTLAIRGHFDITDNASGAVTQSDRVNFETLLDDGTATYDRTTDSLQEIRDNALAAADVLTQVNAALDTAIAELGVAVPAVTPTMRTGLMLMYMALRNQTDVQTSGTDALEIHNDAGVLITKKLLTDSGGDYSEAKVS